MPQLELGQIEAGSWILSPGDECLNHHLLPAGVCFTRNVKLEAGPGLEQETLIRNPGVPSSSLTTEPTTCSMQEPLTKGEDKGTKRIAKKVKHFAYFPHTTKSRT